jgi:LPXTG-motif cell wall-anchored protein
MKHTVRRLAGASLASAGAALAAVILAGPMANAEQVSMTADQVSAPHLEVIETPNVASPPPNTPGETSGSGAQVPGGVSRPGQWHAPAHPPRFTPSPTPPEETTPPPETTPPAPPETTPPAPPETTPPEVPPTTPPEETSPPDKLVPSSGPPETPPTPPEETGPPQRQVPGETPETQPLLPVTGGHGGLFAGVGAALLACGAALVAVSRRRNGFRE